MADEFTVSAFIPALPMAVYMAWLDGNSHSEMTGAAAHSEPAVGSKFDAWDGYIRGETVHLEPGRRIVQNWRTAEFPEDAPDSRIDITLEPEGNGTRVLLLHGNVPAGQGKMYEQGWHDHYFRPMQEYFIHAGITGAPADAGVTEVLRRVASGEAAPGTGDLNVEFEDGVEEIVETRTAPAAHGDAPAPDFDLADDDDGDEFDTAVAKPEPTDSEEWWKHLEAPAGAPPAKAEPKPAKAGRKPASRKPVSGAAPKARPAKPKKAAAKPAKKAPKKAAKKPVKKTAKKTAKKAAKKPVKKAAKKAAKKSVKKPVKKLAKKAVKKAAKKAVKKAKPIKAKSARPVGKKVAGKRASKKPAKKAPAKKKPAKKAPAKKKPAKKPAKKATKAPTKKATRKPKKAATKKVGKKPTKKRR